MILLASIHRSTPVIRVDRDTRKTIAHWVCLTKLIVMPLGGEVSYDFAAGHVLGLSYFTQDESWQRVAHRGSAKFHVDEGFVNI